MRDFIPWRKSFGAVFVQLFSEDDFVNTSNLGRITAFYRNCSKAIPYGTFTVEECPGVLAVPYRQIQKPFPGFGKEQSTS